MRGAGGIGIDLLEIERIERALERRPSLAERVFTDGERAHAAARARPARHLAARFCGKEAVAKALTLESWSWRDVEIVTGESGAPAARLSGSAAARADELSVDVAVSLTHDGPTAGAVAMLVPRSR